MKILISFLLCLPLYVNAAKIADYHMDECSWNGAPDEVVDSTANANHAKVDITGTTTTAPDGQINRAGRFNEDGVVNSAVALPASILDGKNEFTFTTWLNLSGQTGDKNTFLSAEKNDGSDSDEILFRVSGGTITMVYNGSSKSFTNLDASVLFNQWSFLALSVKNKTLGSEFCVTINSGQASTEYQCQSITAFSSALNIEHLVLAQDRAGGEANNFFPGGDLNGMMDEVKFYDSVVSQTELRGLYDQEVQGKYLDGTTPPSISCTPSASLLVDYRMDECYFLGGANGVNGDVIDSSGNNFNASSVDRIDSDDTDAKICRSGAFDANSYAVTDAQFTLGANWSMSIWLKFPFVQTGKLYYILGSYPSRGDLPLFRYRNNVLEWGVYDNAGSFRLNSIDNSLTGWHHLVFVNQVGNTDLYVDGNFTNSITLGSSGDVTYLWTSSDDLGGQSIASSLDEMEFFDGTLSADEIKNIYLGENSGLNYDGTPRDCPSCDSTTISAHTWELVGIPADLRIDPKTVDQIFGDDMQGIFNTDWRVYKRTYSTSDNSSGYQQLALNDQLSFGEGYWLGSSLDERWDVNNTTVVNYDGSNCPTAAGCVEVDLTPVSLNFPPSGTDANDGSGLYRYFYSGFVGINKPVDWADCRFVIGGVSYTPSQAEDSANDFAAKQIWLYNPNEATANPNGYTTCDDTTPGGCKLLPFKGFVVELHGNTKGKTVKLLIPKE